MLVNKDVLSKIKFIGRIEIGDKIDIKNMFLQKDGFITQCYRTFNQETRTKTLIFINDIYSKAFEIIKNYEKSSLSSDTIMCINILNDIKDSKQGLLNLKETYNDTKFKCDIEVIIQLIDAKLIEMQELSWYKSTLSYSAEYPPPPPLSQENDDI